MNKERMIQAMANLRMRMSAIQTEREMLSQRESQAFNDFFDESGMNDPEDPGVTECCSIMDRLSAIFRGPVYGKKEEINVNP